jgi:hypothetical protein
MTNQEILTTLSDDYEYYNGLGRRYISNSDIGTLIRNPKMYGIQSETTSEMLKGSYFHTLALEPHKAKSFVIIDASTRATNIYKDALKEHGESLLLLRSEANEIESMVYALRNNRVLSKLVWDSGNQYEVPFIGKIFGLDFKCKCDIYRLNEKVYDLKTSSSIDEFKYSAIKYNYDSQAWIYQQLTGCELEFIVIEKGTNRLGHFIPTDEFLMKGEQKVLRALETNISHNNYYSNV